MILTDVDFTLEVTITYPSGACKNKMICFSKLPLRLWGGFKLVQEVHTGYMESNRCGSSICYPPNMQI
jgi:hypothetical protein